MIVKKSKPSPFSSHATNYYLDTESGAEYRRIYGGMAWPWKKPGFAVIVGEELEADESGTEHKCTILGEHENQNINDLLRRCEEFKTVFGAKHIFGDKTNLPMMQHIKNGKFRFYLSDAPLSGDTTAIQYYVSLIREMTMGTRKILSFGRGSRLPGILEGFNPESEEPAILALGYALAGLRKFSPPDPRERMDLNGDFEANF